MYIKYLVQILMLTNGDLGLHCLQGLGQMQHPP